MSAVLSNPARAHVETAVASSRSAHRYKPLRRFGATLLLATGVTLAMALLAPVEHAFFAGPALGDAPLVNAMLILALPHYVIALAFMLTSRRSRDFVNRASMGLAFVLGLMLCGWMYLASRQHGLPSGAILLVGFYFIIHIYQDEWQFYRRDRDGRVAMDGATVALLTIALVGTIAALAWLRVTLIGDPVRNLRGAFDSRLLASIDPTLLALTGGVVFAAVVGGCLYQVARRSGASVGSLIRREKTLWLIFWLIPQIYFVSLLVHGKCEPVVLIHLVGWWIFTTSSLATERRRPQESGLWSRIRTTQAGFQWFHGALVGVTVATLMAVAHHDFLVNESHINWIRNAFYYSSVMHITMSMFPPWLTRLFGARAPAAT